MVVRGLKLLRPGVGERGTKAGASRLIDRRLFQNVCVGLLALAAGGVFLVVNLIYNGGQLSAPVDDAFIHLQYGRQIGDGQWFSYNDGDPISTGASSFLYPIILGAASGLLGLGGTQLLAFAIIFGISMLIAAAILGCELGRELTGGRAGLWTGTLIAVNGAFVWGATSGMEVSLLAALLLGGLLAFTRELPRRKFILTPLLLAVVAVTRPEGLIFAAILAAIIAFILLKDVVFHKISWRKASSGGALVPLPLVAGAGQLLFYKLATGSTTANGVQAKSILLTPIFYPFEAAQEALSNLSELFLNVLAGFEPAYLFPGAIFFVVLGVARLAFSGEGLRAVGVALALIFAAVLPSVVTLFSWNWHHYRYVLPFLPLFLLTVVAGIYALSESLTDRGPSRRYLTGGLVGLVLVFSVVMFPGWASTMGRESNDILRQQVHIGRWIRSNLPKDAVVGLNDVGAMRYYGGHQVLDLVGLATNGIAEPHRSGMGSVYEELETLSPEERPEYFVVYNLWVGGLANAGIFGAEPIKTFKLDPSGGLVADDEVFAWKADWSAANSGDLPRLHPAENIKDTLDVAELGSERDHDYKLRMSQPGLQPESTLARLAYPNSEIVADGGRRISGSESFTVDNLSPGEPLKVVQRTAAGEMNGPARLRVSVDGKEAGEWTLNSTNGDWQEPSFTIPAGLVRSETVRIEITSPDRRAPFYYWFSQ